MATDLCSTYNANGADDNAKATNCKALKDAAGTACGFKTSAAKCSAKSCTDKLTAADDAACKTYLPNCYYTASNTCADTKTGACSTYTPLASASTAADKLASCVTITRHCWNCLWIQNRSQLLCKNMW